MRQRLTRLIRSDAARGLAAAAAAGAFLAFLGPFGSDEAPLVQRLAYWIPLMMLAGTLADLCIRLVGRVLQLPGRPALRFLVLVAVITLPLTVLVWGVTGPAFGQPVYPLAALPGMAWRVALITAAMTAVAMAVDRRKPPPADAAGPPRFLDRLPPRLRGAELLAVQAEDHYLRLHTDRGSDLILMRLADALAELEGADGAQTHRSWWVARQAVVEVRRGDGRAVLTLSNGVQAPVSRRHARGLRAAGWY